MGTPRWRPGPPLDPGIGPPHPRRDPFRAPDAAFKKNKKNRIVRDFFVELCGAVEWEWAATFGLESDAAALLPTTWQPAQGEGETRRIYWRSW